jgi:hypothetical protein
MKGDDVEKQLVRCRNGNTYVGLSADAAWKSMPSISCASLVQEASVETTGMRVAFVLSLNSKKSSGYLKKH